MSEKQCLKNVLGKLRNKIVIIEDRSMQKEARIEYGIIYGCWPMHVDGRWTAMVGPAARRPQPRKSHLRAWLPVILVASFHR